VTMQDKVVAYLAKHPTRSYTVREVELATGLERRQAGNALFHATGRGVLERVEYNRYRYRKPWTVLEDWYCGECNKIHPAGYVCDADTAVKRSEEDLPLGLRERVEVESNVAAAVAAYNTPAEESPEGDGGDHTPPLFEAVGVTAAGVTVVRDERGQLWKLSEVT